MKSSVKPLNTPVDQIKRSADLMYKSVSYCRDIMKIDSTVKIDKPGLNTMCKDSSNSFDPTVIDRPTVKLKTMLLAVSPLIIAGLLAATPGTAKSDDTEIYLSLIHISEPTRPY